MSLKYGIVFSILLFTFFSCSKSNQFPAKISEKVKPEEVVLNRTFLPMDFTAFSDSAQKSDFGKEIEKLLQDKKSYDERNPAFNLVELENSWSNLQKQSKNFGIKDMKSWIEITGFMLEITGNARYASELEETVYQSATLFSESDYREIEKIVTPWIFTKDLDYIYVNLFANATIKYEHSLFGAVEITQETEYPKSGKITLKFKMENKRYVELFIRIPEWAEGATVTEWRVKYVANPGEYSQVVRKWNDGDFVEINLPIAQMPKR
jgi:DUF1680 family protein